MKNGSVPWLSRHRSAELQKAFLPRVIEHVAGVRVIDDRHRDLPRDRECKRVSRRPRGREHLRKVRGPLQPDASHRVVF